MFLLQVNETYPEEMIAALILTHSPATVATVSIASCAWWILKLDEFNEQRTFRCNFLKPIELPAKIFAERAPPLQALWNRTQSRTSPKYEHTIPECRITQQMQKYKSGIQNRDKCLTIRCKMYVWHILRNYIALHLHGDWLELHFLLWCNTNLTNNTVD